MGKKVKPGNLAGEIEMELKKYIDTLNGDLDEGAVKIGRETAKEIKVNAQAQGLSRRPRYIKGWSITKRDGKVVVRNRTDGQLTHLLEFGHSNGAKAHPHIEPAEKNAIEKFEKLVEKAVKGK